MPEDAHRSPSKAEVTSWLAEHGDALFRYAHQRVGAADVAEDLVQDTFVAALRSAAEFEGRSKVQTWLVGILRHKIADHLRKLGRDRKREAASNEDTGRVFHNGHWRVGVKQWKQDPTQSAETAEFWQVVDQCQAKLPATLAAAFRMRDLEQLPMSEICEALDITATNLSVRLHRARLLLRECLDQRWFSVGRQA